MKFLSRKFKFHRNLTRIMGTLHEEDQCTFMIIIHSVLPVMGNVSDENCRGNKNKFYYIHTYIHACIHSIDP